MLKQDPEVKMGSDEFSRIFEEYRAKIQDIARKTEKSLEIEVNIEPDKAEEKSHEPAVTQPAPAPVHIESQPPIPESAQIIAEAKRKAKKIVEEAEDSIKKEAKKKTKAEVEKILEKARKEAEDIVGQAKQNIEQEKQDFNESTRQQAETIIKELTERCRQDTQAQSEQIISEAREKAAKMMADVLVGSKEISRMVTEIVNRARVSFNQFEATMRTDTEELMKNIDENQKLLQQISEPPAPAEVEPEPEPEVENHGPRMPSFLQGKNRENKEIITVPTLSIRVKGNKSNGQNGTPPLFQGQVEMKSISEAFDYQYLKNLKKYLVRTPTIKYLQESASEEELSVLFDLQEPLPFLEILKGMPQVDKVVTEKEDISVVFRE